MVTLSHLLGKMKPITKESVIEAHGNEPRRRCFANNSGIQKRKANGTTSFSIPLIESAKKVFEKQTNLDLFFSRKFNNYWRALNTSEELVKVEEWEKSQGSLIYLRDCLELSVAINTNLKDNTSGQYTEIGQLEHDGKINQDQAAIKKIAATVSSVINFLPFYQDADLICSVPPRPDKDFDLPSSVTAVVSTLVNKQNITDCFVFNGTKSSVKATSFDEKWQVWEDAQVSFQNSDGCNLNGKTIILIDDKYQSGITIQYIAMKLQQAGARKVYGLCFVKTLRDTDNT